MAQSKPVSPQDIIKDGLFDNTKASAEQALVAVSALEQAFVKIKKDAEEYLKTNKGFSNSKDVESYVAQIEKLNATIEKLKKLQAEKTKIEKTLRQEELEAIKVKRETERLEQQKIRTERLKQNEQVKALKAAEKARLQAEKENSAYFKLTQRLNGLRKEYKDIALTQGENSRAAITLQREIEKLNTKIKRVDASAGQFQRNVGNYPKPLNAMANGLLKVASAMGIVFGLQAVFNIFKGGVSIFREFEDANVRVASVLGKTVSETKELQADAERLGATTAKSATEVVKLQEAYARLGFSQSEIIDLTEPTINGSIALNAELSATAALVGAMVNSFDEFSTTDAPQILDSMTLATQRSALSFSQLETMLPIVSGAANAAGVPFTEMVSLLGKLSDAGLDASTAATSLRNIFIESSTQGKNYTEILGELATSTDALTDSNDEFGKRGAVAAAILSKNIEGANELKTALDGAGGTAQRVAEQNLQTLSGQLTLLQSAYEGFILSIENGNGTIGNFLKQTVQITAAFFTLLTNFNKSKEELDANNVSLASTVISLRTLLKTIGVVITGYAAYRGTLIATNFLLTTQRGLMISLGSAKRAYVTILGIATKAQNVFNTATKGNIFGIIAGLIASAAAAMFLYGKRTNDAADSQKELNEAMLETQKLLDNLKEIERTFGQLNNLNERQTIDFIARINEQIAAEEDKFLQFKKLNEDFFNDQENNPIFEEELRNRLADFLGFQREVILTSEGAQIVQNENERLLTRIIEGENLKRLDFINKAANDRLKALKKGNKEEQKEVLSYEKQLRDSRTRLLEIENVRELQTLRNNFNDQIEQLKSEGRFYGELKISLETEFNKKRAELRDKFIKDREKIENDAELARVRNLNEGEILLLQTKLLEMGEVESEAAKKIQKEIENLQIEGLENELRIVRENTELTNEERFKMEQEILNRIAGLRTKEIEKTEDLRQKELDSLTAYYSQVSQIVIDAINAQSQARSRAFDEENRQRDRQTQIQAVRAAAGLENTLAFQEQQAAEAEVKNRERLKREQRAAEITQLTQAFYTAYNEFLKADPNTAIAKATASTFGARGVAQGLFQFFSEGTDYITQKGGKSPFSKGRDTVPIMAEVGEAVLKRKANLANPEVAKTMNNGTFNQVFERKGTSSAENMYLSMQLLSEVKKLNAKPVQQVSVDRFGNMIETVYRNGAKEVLTHRNRFAKK